MKMWIIFLCVLKLISASPTPVVLWHGMGDTCCVPFSLGAIKEYLEQAIPGVYVRSLKMGNSTIEDFESGYFMNPNQQVEYACKLIAADPLLKNGFNAIGFSQGSQFLRAVVQRCGHKIPRVKTLISMGGQHQGVYGLPRCGVIKRKTCDYLRKLLNYAAYVSWVQNYLVQATYWHDPLDERTYKKKSAFLADINNENRINKTYVTNLNNLDHFVLVKFENDTIVVPRETEWFGYYVPGQSKKMQTLQQSDIYLKDRLGLKAMDNTGKLVFLSVAGDHLRFTQDWLTKNLINPYLRN